jgi:hypothetical protein
MIKELLFFCSIAGADLGTTRYITNRGGRELNPGLKSERNMLFLKSAQCIGQSIITSKVDPRKRKRLYIIGGIIGGSFVVWNGIQIGKMK